MTRRTCFERHASTEFVLDRRLAASQLHLEDGGRLALGLSIGAVPVLENMAIGKVW